MAETLERFWDKVDKSGDCWLWTGSCDRFGYGQIKVNGKNAQAHRHVMGQPDGHVLHKCDTPGCVNPDHLYVGTHSDNMIDRAKRGGYKLNPEKVREARAYIAQGCTHQDVADFLRVSRATISLMHAGTTWSHVT